MQKVSLPTPNNSTTPSSSIPSPTGFLSHGDIEKLYSHFLTLDADGNGILSHEEFLAIPTVRNNPLATRLLAIFDPHSAGFIDFEQFCNVLAVFGAASASKRGGGADQREKLRLAFAIYDWDGDGYISPGELFLGLRQMTGATHLDDVQLQQVVDKTIRDADLDVDGRVSFEEFERIVVERNHDFIERWTLSDI